MKRLIIATLSGLLFGFVCFGFACSGSDEVATWLGISIITGRTLLGFGIGISRFSMGHWSIHGLVMGLIFSLPMAFGAMMGSDNPDMSAINDCNQHGGYGRYLWISDRINNDSIFQGKNAGESLVRY